MLDFVPDWLIQIGFWWRVALAVGVVILIMAVLKLFGLSILGQLKGTLIASKHAATVLSALVFGIVALVYFSERYEAATIEAVTDYWFNWMTLAVIFMYIQGVAALFGRVDDVFGALFDIIFSFIALMIVLYAGIEYSHQWSDMQWHVYFILLTYPVYDCGVNVFNALKLRGRLSGLGVA